MNVTAISGGNPSFNGLMNFRNAKKLINSQLLDVYDVSIESKKVVSIDGISDRVLNALNNPRKSNYMIAMNQYS